VLSLARAFFLAGAQAVVGTLRPLPDDQGQRFFQDFYRQLGRGLSLRQALAATQREWIVDGMPASTWSHIVLLGDGDLVPIPGGLPLEEKSGLGLLIGVPLVLLLLVLAYRWSKNRHWRPRSI
jgi:hypothetical protein